MPRVNRNIELSENDRKEILLRYLKIKNHNSDESVVDLCQEYQIGRNYPAALFKKFQATNTLRSKSRQGRPSKVQNQELQNQMVHLIRTNRRRNSTCRRLARQLNCAPSTANEMRSKLKMRICKKVARPILSAENIRKRLEFVAANPRPSRRTAFLDEKWWECYREKKHIYRRSNSPVEFEHRPAHKPKLMFVAVISAAADDGKVGLWPVAEMRRYQRNSRYHHRGDVYWRDLTCDGQFFTRLLDNEILPLCENYGIEVLQMDNARPHVTDNNVASIREVMERHPTIQLLMQAPQSPDLNPLDSGVIADRVELLDPQNRDELHACVNQTWNDLRRRDIMKYVAQQTDIRDKIAQNHGGNRFI